MSRLIATDLLVVRTYGSAACVSGYYVLYAVNLSEDSLDAPETAAC
jgi:hypothetical protein